MSIINEMKKEHLIWHIVMPTLLVLLCFVTKGFFISSNSIAGDEPFSIYMAQMDVTSIIANLAQGNNPPLYELILHFWIQFFGISAVSVRFLSLIFSALSVLLIYRLGFKHINKRVAIYASIIFIFSNYHTLFAHESRTYALLGMLSLASMYYFLNLVSSNILSKKNSLIAYVIASTLLIYAHYFGFFILISQAIFLVLNRSLLIERWKSVWLITAVLILLYAPNIIILMRRLVDSAANGTWLQPPDGIEAVYSMLRAFCNAPVVTVFVISVLIAAMVKYFITRQSDSVPHQSAQLIIIWFTFIFFFMFIISFKTPMFLDRYLMPAAIVFPLLVAMACDYLISRKGYGYIIPIIICILFIASVKPNITNKRNVKETVEKVSELKDASTIVYLSPARYDINFIYYYNQQCFKNYNKLDVKANLYQCLVDDNIFPIDNQTQIKEGEITHFNQVVFLDAGAGSVFPHNGIFNRLSQSMKLQEEFEFYEIFKIYRFVRE